MIVYQFIYCSCIYESGWDTVSLHKTKLGAYRAMNKYLNDWFTKEFDKRIKVGKKVWSMDTWKIGTHAAWGVSEIKLLD